MSDKVENAQIQNPDAILAAVLANHPEVSAAGQGATAVDTLQVIQEYTRAQKAARALNPALGENPQTTIADFLHTQDYRVPADAAGVETALRAYQARQGLVLTGFTAGGLDPVTEQILLEDIAKHDPAVKQALDKGKFALSTAAPPASAAPAADQPTDTDAIPPVTGQDAAATPSDEIAPVTGQAATEASSDTIDPVQGAAPPVVAAMTQTFNSAADKGASLLARAKAFFFGDPEPDKTQPLPADKEAYPRDGLFTGITVGLKAMWAALTAPPAAPRPEGELAPVETREPKIVTRPHSPS